MAESWPWLWCLKRANAVSARCGRTYRRGHGAGRIGLGRSSPRLSGIVPDVRSAIWRVSFRILDLWQADLGEQGGALTSMLTIVWRPLDQFGDGGQRVVPETGLGVDEWQTLATRLGDLRPQTFRSIDALDRAARQDVSGPATRIGHDCDEPPILHTGGEADAVIRQADAVHSRGDRRRQTRFDERLGRARITDRQLHRERGGARDEPVERGLLLHGEAAVIGRQRGEHEQIPRRATGAAAHTATRRATEW